MIEFKGGHFERDVILWCVRWYVVYPISYRRLEEMMEERRRRSRPFHAQSLGGQIRAVAGSAISRPQASGWLQLANGRGICEGQRPLFRQASGAANARFQIVSIGCVNHCRHRTHAHDPQGPNVRDR
jgi:hypothetical protein